MRLGGNPELGHLTYCTNIHSGEEWAEVRRSLQQYLPVVKADFTPDAPMGLGLRLSAAAGDVLQRQDAMDELKQILRDYGCYVFTINGFPYGVFHGQPVKEGAYQPDWADPLRLHYSNRLATLLAELLPDDIEGTVSTVPGTFRPWAPGRIDGIVDNLIRHTAHLISLREQTGKTVSLTLEPEPYCLLETIAEAVAFFQERLFAPSAELRLSALTGLSRVEAADALHRHLGLCYDVCHAAVEFEDPSDSIRSLQEAGIAIGKIQLSSALKIRHVGPETVTRVKPFDEPVYLHQVVARHGTKLTRYVDLPDALDDIAQTPAGTEWRVHFHVPVFLEELEAFSTTQDFLREILAIHRRTPISQHLEVETYTWDVLPEALRNVSLGTAIARELNWVKAALLA